MKVKYTELPHCEVKGFCDKLSSTPMISTPMISTPIENIDCEACRAGMPVHTAEVLDFCANAKGAYAILLRDDGRIVALPLRHAEMYLDLPETRENGGPAS